VVFKLFLLELNVFIAPRIRATQLGRLAGLLLIRHVGYGIGSIIEAPRVDHGSAVTFPQDGS